MVAPCLSSALGSILGHLKGVFPPAAACLAAQGTAANRPAPGAPAIARDAWLDEDEEDDEGNAAYWLENKLLHFDSNAKRSDSSVSKAQNEGFAVDL